MRHGALKGTRADTLRTHGPSELTQQSELLTAVLLLREGTLLVLVGTAPSEF